MQREPLGARLRSAAARLAKSIDDASPSTQLVALVFAAFTAITFAMHARAPIGPGQDYHYHLMVAAMTTRSSSDPVRALYHDLPWLDANTLVYRVAAPLVAIFGPLRGFQGAVALLYYLGFPAAIWYALRRAGRAAWAMPLAFVFVYGRVWSVDGFVPFLTAATFMVLSLAEWDAILARRDAAARPVVLRAAAFSTLLFLAHGHTYAWTMAVLALATIVTAVKHAAAAFDSSEPDRFAPLREVCVRSLIASLPSAVLAVLWVLRTRSLASEVAPTVLEQAQRSRPYMQQLDPMLRGRMESFHQYFEHLASNSEVRYSAALALLVAALLLFARRDEGRSLTFELFSLASLLTSFVLPGLVHGQSVAPRHLEFFVWTLPLVLWPAAAPAPASPDDAQPTLRAALGARGSSLFALVIAFSVARMLSIQSALERMNRDELAPMLALVEPCRAARARPYSLLAYVPMQHESNAIKSWSLQQAHETFAALCGVETPVYDTRKSPHHLLPLRYRSAMPAPTGLFERRWRWFSPDEDIIQRYDLVLTYRFEPSPSEQPSIDQYLSLVGRSGGFRLYRRKPGVSVPPSLYRLFGMQPPSMR
ncbi:MAG: hypothetical protein JNK05_08655 [Myxococcales bacterium]|nr:hypothetical protein [Myxococcales bacterium]